MVANNSDLEPARRDDKPPHNEILFEFGRVRIKITGTALFLLAVIAIAAGALSLRTFS
ncbi:hypothetical protein So717_43100 [Roseobacter cerasinus]|uniref:Uncharacterized protein n=1 Tax=Roseobacter cerasinus TaxID=2602289 RepID=A0A640VXB9_9RHOB|nr:hypothetical protein So717_43100 [Roseobacter cerasinus]